MKLNPKQAPVYGECVLTVNLSKRSKRKADVFYLLFTGSKQRHVASTRRVNSATLQTVAPAHGCCEIVTVSLCVSKKGSVVVLGEESFEFIHDEAYDSAQFLAANATNQQALNFARFLISAQPRPGDVTILDKKITLAFKHLKLPSGWNVLGETPLPDGQKQETLMHFAARLGLCHLSKFLLDQPGGRTALTISNNNGATPARLASERGSRELVHLFSENDSKGTPKLNDLSHIERFRDCWLNHHLELNVYILTREADTKTHIRMETLIEDLGRYIEGHSSCQDTCVKSEQEPVSEETTDLCHQDAEKNFTDKPLDLHSDSDGTENKSSTPCSEESCTSDKVEERSVNIGSEVETVGGDRAMFSFAGTSKEPKEEEEGTKSIVESEDASVTHQHIQRFPTEVRTSESLLSSGNPNEETGMTSTGIVLDHECLCGRDNLGEEMITTTERATPDVALTEAPDKATVLTLAADVDMGQALPGYCTSTASSKDTVGNTENSEQEMGAVTLLMVNENQAIDSFNDSSCQGEINLCLLNATVQCDIEESSLQPQECTAIKAMDCTKSCDMKGSETSVSASQSESLAQIVDDTSVTAKEGNALTDVADCQPKCNGADAGSMLENEVAVTTAATAQSIEDLCVGTEEDMPGPCASSVQTIDAPSTAGTSEQGAGEALVPSVNDNQTTFKSVNADQGEPSPFLIAENGQCDIVESGQSPDCSAVSTLDCVETCEFGQTETKVSFSQSESMDLCTDSMRAIAEDENAATDADTPVCSFHDCVGEEKGAVKSSAPSPQDTLDTETPSLVDCVEEEEPGEVAQQAPAECDRVEDSSEVLKVSRASLHPIAEESLHSGDSSSDNAPTSSESEASSVLSDSEKPVHAEEETTGQGMNQLSSIVDCPIEHIAAALVNAVVDSTAKLCMKEMVNAASGMPENDYTQCSSDQQSDSLQANKDYEQVTGESVHMFKEDDSGLDLSVNMEETQCPSISDTEIVLEHFDGKAEDEVDFVKPSAFVLPARLDGLSLAGHLPTEGSSIEHLDPHQRSPFLQSPNANCSDWDCLDFLWTLSLRVRRMYERHKRRYSLCDISKVDRTVDVVLIKINRENCCSLTPCPHMVLLESKQTSDSKVCQQFLEDGLDTEHSSPPTLKRESTSEADLCYMAPEVLDEMVFSKLEEEQSLCDISSLGSDDNTSLERNSSHGSDISIPHTLSLKKQRDRLSMDSSCSSTVTASVEERECENTEVSEMEGEEMDNITEVSPHITRSKSAIRSDSPHRRHSWEPWKHAPSESEISRRSSFRNLGDGVRKPTAHKRSLSWCPSTVHLTAVGGEINYRSCSLEGLAGKTTTSHETSTVVSGNLTAPSSFEREVRSGSSLSLTEEKTESDQRRSRASHHQDREKTPSRGFVYPSSGFAPHMTKSMSLTTISNPLVETQTRIRPKRRISFSFNISPLIPKSRHVFTVGSSSSDDESDSSQSLNIPRNSLAQSIPEESCDILPLSPSQKDLDLKGGTKVSRTFSYLRHKMSGSKKTKEKERDKDKTKEKEKEPKEKDKDKKTINGHVFSSTPVVGPFSCNHCTKSFNKDGYICTNCNSVVHKGCRENFTHCAKVKMKQQKVLQPNDTSSLPVVIMRNKGSQPKERPRSAVVAPEEATFSSLSFSSRRPQTTISISKSISTQNIAGVGCDENIWSTWKVLSQSTDSLHKISKVHESMESLVDEGTDMNEGQLMGEFEADSKQLEAESWSQTVDSKFLKQQKKEVVKQQDVIYELMQTEMHHVRTLKIMNEVYYRGMLTELQFEQKTLEKIFPCIDDLLNIHTKLFQRLLERKKESMADKSEHNFVIRRIGDILVHQFSGEKAEHMKRTYGKFCGHHNEAVNYFKDLLAKEKRFQAFIKKKGSSTLVRRLGIPECILLVTQRITKYPVILQRILQYTKENEIEHQEVEKALNLVKDVITEVNNKVNNYEKKKRLNEIYNKTDSKSIQRMKSGQMFAKEDLKRRKLVRDGTLFLRSNPANRIKEVLAVLLADVLVFLQEKDQKYAFASLEQKSTVISLKNLIIRKVAHDEKGLFLISMIGKDPEMVEVLTNTKEERDSWIDTIQNTMTTMDKDEDEGVPSESEEEKKNWDTKARELRGQLHQKDEQILTLLEEKEKLFQALTLCSGQEENSPSALGRTLFRANTEEAPRGEPLIKSAIKEVETLEVLVNQYLWSSLVAQESGELENGVGPVSLPRRAETFGGFDSHQLSASKCGEKDEGEDAQDLRRTESDSVLKKGVNPSVVVKRNGMQVLLSVSNLHKYLKSLQGVVVQQDTYIEDQKMMLSKGTLTWKSRPSSLNYQEKQRSLEKLRQEISSLEKQQAQHREEKLRNEGQWECREKKFAEWKEWSSNMDDDIKKSMQEMEQKKHRLEIIKALGQCDAEGLEEEIQPGKTQEQRNKDPKQVSFQHDKVSRVPSLPGGMDSKWCDSNSTKQEQLQSEASTLPKKDCLLRTDSKQKGKGHFNLLGSQSNKSAEGHSSNRLFNLAKPKEKKDKKKKSKGPSPITSEPHPIEGTTEEEEIFC
ncbi:PREDICTED: A-kinase anchor protein 13 [Nanorana parkeri]|uniref:A-kinase anchor protein 13 n=1 Tax=Nanorana parkeri TaxID=125878 RepID=UPI000854BD27|nr:PREDICTED: A-kinase anchor protein 13 [Nanorana parkeri]